MNKTQEEMFLLLQKEVQKIHTPLDTLQEVRKDDPFRTLIQTILTAQTKDSLTAPISKALFENVGDKPEYFLKLSVEELQEHIFPVSYYKTKAKHLLQTCQLLLDNYNGIVPKDFDALVSFPGVGPKTANIVLADAFGVPAIAVDIHVHRISNRLGIIKTHSREKSLKELQKILPKKYWLSYNTTLVKHGQTICSPVSPKCSTCPIVHLCPKIGVAKNR